MARPTAADRVPARHLRHPAEVPFYVFMVVLNVAIIAAIRAGAVQLSPRQYPDLYATVDDFARRLGLGAQA